MGYIYALHHPITNEIRYIGKTSIPLELRLKRHIYQCKTGKSHIKSWIKSLLTLNIKPIISQIEICNLDELNKREIYWIDYYSKIYKLCNITKGGEGGSRNKEYALDIQSRINSVIELVNKGYKLKESEIKSGLSNGYLSKARKGLIQFVNDNNILVPNLLRKSNRKNKIIDNRTGTIYNTQKEAAIALGVSDGTIYNMLKQQRHLRVSK